MYRWVSGRTLLLAGGVGSVLAAAMFVATLWITWQDARDLRGSELRLEVLAQDLLQTIGYTGMIHNFKNCVLRPDEPDYCTNAASDARRALDLMDQIEALSRERELDIELPELRTAVLAYAENVPRVIEGHAAQEPVRDLDAAVRVDDLPAARNLRETISAARETISARISGIGRSYFTQSVAGIAAMLLLAALFVALSRYESRVIREKQERLDAVFTAILGGVVGFDGQGRIRLVNPPARRLLNLATAAPPMDWPARLHVTPQGDEAGNEPEDIVGRVLKGTPISGELYTLGQDGAVERPRYLRLSSAKLSESTSGLGAVLFMEDVTDQERNRQKIERSSRLDALGELSGGIAHDFNNLLATILYAVELSLKEPQTPRATDLLGRALATVDRARQLTERLLAFGRRSPGKVHSWPVTQAFEDFEALARTAIGAEIELVLDVESPDLLVHCDQAQLENALLNLVINSRDAIRDSGRGGKIILQARPVETAVPETGILRRGKPEVTRFVEISITDDGPGMDEETRQRATDPFFTKRLRGRGTGLGLAMVYGFVQQSQGDLKIYSAPDHGTTIRMTLPRGTREDRREPPVGQGDVQHGDGETVLLVEDEADLLDMMSALLADLGYRVGTATSGQEAWDRIAAGERFDILLSDVVMPGGMSGIDLAQKVRERMPGAAVILMSGYAGLSQTRSEAPDVPILQKPCMPGDLARALRDVRSQKGRA